MRGSRVLPWTLLAVLGLTAQTPGPSTQAPPPHSLRHLEYAFTLHEDGTSEYHFNGAAPAAPMSNGVGSVATSDGGSGTIDADVLSLAPDGALVVQISEWVYLEPRPRQSYICNVYGNTTVVCPSAPAPSQAEWVLLSYLGRQFIDNAPWDAHNHWQRLDRTGQYTVQEDFTLIGTDQSGRVIIDEKKKIDVHNGGFSGMVENTRITYDHAKEVPDAIHDDVVESGSDGSEHDVFDFQLKSDSLAKQ
jgi:hypothetical protein